MLKLHVISQSVYQYFMYSLFLLIICAIVVLQNLNDAGFLSGFQQLVEKKRVAKNVVSLLNKVLHNKYPNFSTSKEIQAKELLTWKFWPDFIKTVGKTCKYKLLCIRS